MAERDVYVEFPDPKTGQITKKHAIEVDVIEETTPWSIVKLEDGSTLRFKNPVIKAFRVIGEFSPEGDPVYLMKQGALMDISSPDSLRKKG
jgi:hypothetical protein